MSRGMMTMPAEIEQQLDQLKRQIRQIGLIRGLSLATVVLVLCMAVALSADLLLVLSSPMRWGLLCGVVVLTGWAVWRAVLRPLLSPLSETELAAIVERAHPELRERLTSCIELSDDSIPEAIRGSALMREILVNQTVAQTGQLEFGDAVSPTRALRLAYAAALAVLVTLAPLLRSPDGYGQLLSRLFVPWGNHDSVGNLIFEVENGDRVVARGSDVEVAAALEWRFGEEQRPNTIWLNWRDANGETDHRRMEYDAYREAFVTTIPHVFEEFDFHVSHASNRSREFHIRVEEAPEITSAHVTIEPPAYTGYPAEQHDGAIGTLHAFERSRLEIALEFNKPVDSAEIAWYDPEAAVAGAVLPVRSEMVLSADGKSATLSLAAEFSATFDLVLTDAFGLQNSDDADRQLVVRTDLPPGVEFVGEQTIVEARPSDTVAVDVAARDDVSVGELELEVIVDGQQADPIVANAAALNVSELEYQFALDLSQLPVQHESILTYRVRAADERETPGPQETWTEFRTITINRDAETLSAQEVLARQQALHAELDAIREQLAENRKQVDELQREADADHRQQLDFTRNEEIAPRSREQLEIAQRLDQFAEQLDLLPLFEPLAERAHKLARFDLPEASRGLAPATEAALAEKVRLLAENVDGLKEVERELEAIAKEFEKIAEIEKDLLELNRLAERARELAEQAIAMNEQRQREAPPNETAAEAEKRQEAEQAEEEALAEDQQELMNDLDELLEERPELLEAARNNEIEKLRELAEFAKAIAEPQDLLADAIRAEAGEIPGEFDELAARQEALNRDAERLSQASKELTEESKLPRVNGDAMKQTVADLKNGNLEDALEQQRRAEQELERLSKELEKLANADKGQDSGAKNADAARKANALAGALRKAAEQTRDQAKGGNTSLEERDEGARRTATAAQKANQIQAASPTAKNARDEALEKLDDLAKAQREAVDAAQQLDTDTTSEELMRDLKETLDAQAAAEEAAAKALEALGKQLAADAKKPPAGANAGEHSERAEELAEQQAALSRDVEAALQAAAQAQADQAAANGDPTAEAGDAATKAEQTQAAAEAIQERQRQLARDAADLAVKAAAETGRGSKATQQAAQLAQQATKAARQSMAGQLPGAAEQAKQAAQSAAEAAEQASAGNAGSELAERAAAIAQEQADVAGELAKMAASPAARQSAQTEGQKQLQAAAQSLAGQLATAARRLGQKPLNLAEESQQAANAQQSTESGEQAMERSAEARQQGYTPEAVESARQAAEDLRRAAAQALGAAEQAPQSDTPVPDEVGEQVTDAAQSLQDAQKNLAEAMNQQNKSASSQQGQQGQKSQNDQGQSQQQSKTSSSQQQPSFDSLQKSAEAMKKAAQSLSQAAECLACKNGNGKPGQGSAKSANGDKLADDQLKEPSENGDGNGAVVPVDLSDLEIALQQAAAGEWGKLPGKLRTEILQAERKRPNGDYARLIRLYFEEISRTKPARTGGGNQ